MQSPDQTEPTASIQTTAIQDDGRELVQEELVRLEQDLTKVGNNGKTVNEHALKLLRKRWQSLCESEQVENSTKDKINTRFSKIRKRVEKQVERRHQDYEKLDHALQHFEAAVKADKLKEALEFENQARAILKRNDTLSKERRQIAHGRLNAAQSKLDKLKGWRRWGTNVTREKLIEQIEQLVGDRSQPPPELAKQIQDARNLWQVWDKTSDSAGKILWERFDKACTAAYKPCETYFKKQGERRANNAKRLHELCDTLEKRYDETDWHHADWRDIDRFVIQAKNTWRKKTELEHRDRRRLNKRFSALMNAYEPHLKLQWKRDRHRRERLIALIESIDENMDMKKALDEVKRAQSDWKPVVLGSRKEEQALWEKFKNACDQVYARKNKLHKEVAKNESENLAKKQAICDELEALCVDEDMSTEALNNKLGQYSSQWREIGFAPRKYDKSVEQRFRNARQKLHAHIESRKQNLNKEINQTLIAKAKLCRQLELNELSNEEVKSALDKLATLPDEIELLLQARFNQACKEGPLDQNSLGENVKILQEICLKMEVIAEIDSPAEFSRDRMAYQVNRLSTAMSGKPAGGETSSGSDSFIELERAFWLCGPVPHENFTMLEARYENAKQAVSQS